MLINIVVHRNRTHRSRAQDRGVGKGHWVMSPLGRRRRPLRLLGAIRSRMFYRENVVGGRPQAPSNDEKFLRKVPPMTTVLGEVAPS